MIFLSNEILHCKQYGFRKNSMTELAVNQIFQELIETFEKKNAKWLHPNRLFIVKTSNT